MIDPIKLRALLLAGSNPIEGATLVPKDMDLASLEGFQATPNAHRGRYEADHVDDFLSYIATDAPYSNNPHVFLSDQGGGLVTATAIFDFGGVDLPEWGRHRAVFTPLLTSAFAALLGLAGKPATQKTLLDFVDDWGDHATFFRPDGSPLALDLARTEFATLTAEKVRTLKSTREDFNRQRSEIEKLTLGNGLPNRMTFTVAPWEGFATHAIRARLGIDDSGSGLLLSLTLTGQDTIYRALTDELRQRLIDLKAPVTVLRGHFE